MAAPNEITPGCLGLHTTREMRIQFANRASLLSGFARAQGESWIEDCRVDLPRRELWIRMAGGFHMRPPLRGRGALHALGRLRPLRRSETPASRGRP